MSSQSKRTSETAYLERPSEVGEKQVARTADFAVRVFSVATIVNAPYSIAVSKLRRPFLADRYFSIVVRLLRRRELVARTADFAARVSSSHQRKAADRKYGGLRYPRLARAFNRLQQIRRQERRRAKRTLRFDRRPRENALRSARTNLIAPSRAEKTRTTKAVVCATPGWREPSTHCNEYAGRSADQQNERCGLIVDRVRMPSDPRARI